MPSPETWTMLATGGAIIALGFCLIVGVVTVLRWPWQRRRQLPGGVEQMVNLIGPLTERELSGIVYVTLQRIDANGYATWGDVQLAVAWAREHAEQQASE